MNPALDKLQPYPFERLRALLAGAQPPADKPLIPMYIGEPRHAAPKFVVDALTSNMQGLGSYPLTAGIPELRAAIANWLTRRFQLPAGSLSSETMVLPVNGTREALFAFAQATTDASKQPLLVMPNPFYQIYEGAALLAGAEPYFMPNQTDGGLPDLDAVPADVWRRCQILFICSPSNPTGAVASIDYLRHALALASLPTSVTAKSISTKPSRRRACCRPRRWPAIRRMSGASCSTVCRSVPACLDCARVSSRATRKF
jgi:N-succinyldiaminopimelate aminotransferase